MKACPAIDRLEALVRDAVDAGEAVRLERHMAGCPACRGALATIERNERLLHDLRPVLAGRDRGTPAPLVGRRFGRYVLKGILGSGGMSTVYEAEQESPRRIVALKVMARGLSSAAARARFAREVEVLGRLHHHAIAQVYEAGTEDDAGGSRPWFAMELVSGSTLAEYADGARLDARARLVLVARVCDAVEYAHEHGVIHRDLKPSNIMVDEHGQPKILDFGVARAADPDDRSLRTETGQLVGTIAYMSPEQAAGMPEIDARADVYALGVIVFELLTKRLPVDVRSRTALEALRAVAEVDPPRLGVIDRSFRGDLEVMVAKALEKDPSRRYASAAALAADIRRFLDDVPITARSPTGLYYLRKFARRHRVVVAASVAVVAALILGLAGTSLAMWRSEQRRTTAESVSELLDFALRSANPHEVKGVGYTVRQLLDDFSRDLPERLRGQPAVEARISATIGNAYRLLGDYPKATAHLDRALELRRGLYGEGHPLFAQSLHDRAWVLHDQAQYDQAEALFRRALEIERGRRGERHADAAKVLHGLSDVLRHTGRFEEAAALAGEALAIRFETLGEDHPDTGESFANLAKLARDRGDLTAFEDNIEAATRVWQRRYGDDHPRLVDGLNDRAWLQYLRRELPGARRTLEHALDMGRRILGENHPDVANTLYELGVVLDTSGDAEGAEAHLRSALAIYRAAHGERHPSVGSTLEALAQLLMRARRDFTGAEPLAREALETRRAVLGPAAGETGLSTATLARVLHGLGRPEEAEVLFREAVGVLRTAYGSDHTLIAAPLYHFGLLLHEQGRDDEAEVALRESWGINTVGLGPAHANTVLVAIPLAATLNSRSKFEHAEAITGPIAALLLEGPASARTANLLEVHAAALQGLGRHAEAERSLTRACDLLAQTVGPAHERTLAVLERLAVLYDAMDAGERANQVRAEVASRRAARTP